MAHDISQAFVAEHGFRHTRKRRKLVDDIAQIADLTNDSAGKLSEYSCAIINLFPKPALQTFGCQLDGRQRILDLVRNPPRYICPRSLSLVRQLLGNIFKGYNVTRVKRGNFNRECLRLGAITDLYDGLTAPLNDKFRQKRCSIF